MVELSVHQGIYRCVHQGGPICCLLGLSFTKEPGSSTTMIVHHHRNSSGARKIERTAVEEQIQRAVMEKENEYGKKFYVSCIEYVENDDVPYLKIYYEHAKKIIDYYEQH